MGLMSSSNGEEGANWSHIEPSREFRVEYRVAGSETVVLARVTNVFPHHDTLTQYVSRFLSECGASTPRGELVLVDDDTNAVLARRDLYRAFHDFQKARNLT
jgi:hypothetical protein